MNTRHRTLRAISGLLMICSLAACGDNDDQVDGPAWVTQGKVTDSSGAPVADADVSVTLDKTYSTKSGADGGFSLSTPQSYSYPTNFAGLVTKTGWVPTPIYFSYQNGTLSAGRDVRARRQGPNEVVLNTSLRVVHLGDSNYSGAENSQFQTRNASGTFWFEDLTLSTSQKMSYTQLCVTFNARGVQSNSVVQDLVSVSKGGQPGTFIVLPIQATDPAGGYTTAQHCFPIGSFAANEAIRVQINSMQTAPGDYDDFEFLIVLGEFR